MTYQELQEQVKRMQETIAILRGCKKLPTQFKVPQLHRNRKYPFHKMEVGDNFVVPCQNSPCGRQQVMNSLTSCIANCREKTGRRFVQRSEGDAIRVWRVA